MSRGKLTLQNFFFVLNKTENESRKINFAKFFLRAKLTKVNDHNVGRISFFRITSFRKELGIPSFRLWVTLTVIQWYAKGFFHKINIYRIIAKTKIRQNGDPKTLMTHGGDPLFRTLLDQQNVIYKGILSPQGRPTLKPHVHKDPLFFGILPDPLYGFLFVEFGDPTNPRFFDEFVFKFLRLKWYKRIYANSIEF